MGGQFSPPFFNIKSDFLLILFVFIANAFIHAGMMSTDKAGAKSTGLEGKHKFQSWFCDFFFFQNPMCSVSCFVN